MTTHVCTNVVLVALILIARHIEEALYLVHLMLLKTARFIFHLILSLKMGGSH